MQVKVSAFPLQRVMHALPRTFRRIKIAQFLAAITGSPYHRIVFEQGETVGNVRDNSIANALVHGAMADYGYFALADSLLTPGDTHVDIGANYGFYTFGLLRANHGRNIRYVLLDANPDCVACMRATAELQRDIPMTVLHAAVSLETGGIPFTFSTSSTVTGHVGAAAGAGEVEVIVPASPLDDLFEANGIDRIGLIKMDIEGSEPVALKSLSKMLSGQQVNFVYFEVNPECLVLQGADPEQIFQEFAQHGYRIFWPHDSLEWIVQTYGVKDVDTSTFKRFLVGESKPHAVIEFDPSLYRKDIFGQCDLLAVSPRSRIEAA